VTGDDANRIARQLVTFEASIDVKLAELQAVAAHQRKQLDEQLQKLAGVVAPERLDFAWFESRLGFLRETSQRMEDLRHELAELQGFGPMRHSVVAQVQSIRSQLEQLWCEFRSEARPMQEARAHRRAHLTRR
jgi:hypothetical protein